MKYWYQSAPMKAVLLVLEHIFAMTAVVALVTLFICPGSILDSREKGKLVTAYEDTEEFATDLQNAADSVMCGIRSEEIGELKERNAIIDVSETYKRGRIAEGDQSGLTFHIRDLLNYGIEVNYRDSYITVCEKEDGTYRYLTEELADVDSEAYVDIWQTEHGIPDALKTSDGKNIIELVNTDERWNGKLSEIEDMIQSVVYDMKVQEENVREIEDNYMEGNSNLTYLYIDYETGRMSTNCAAFQEQRKAEAYLSEMTKQGKYIITTERLADFQTNTKVESERIHSDYSKDFLFAVSVDTTYPVQDSFYYNQKEFESIAPITRSLFIPGIISVIGFLIGAVWLTVVAGHNKGEKEAQLAGFDRVPLEVAAFAGTCIVGTCLALVNDSLPYYTVTENFVRELYLPLFLLCLLTLVCCMVVFTLYLTCVRRLKGKVFIRSTLIYLIYAFCRKWIGKCWRKGKRLAKEFAAHQKCIVKAVGLIAAYMIANWIIRVCMNYRNAGVFCLIGLAIDGFVAYKIVKWAVSKDKLEKGIKQLADGDIQYQIPEEGLSSDDTRIAGYVNHMGDGFQKAVEQSMKDERLKTELLTNVSHDIKTPLTSIINYIDLLKREEIQDDKIQGYIAVLEKKAARLKQLTEDVTEASKISSGNISIEYQNLDFVQILQQTIGEFDEKFEKKNLTVVMDIPNPPVSIRADSRRLWRVLENLFHNVAKYSMPGTRVYASLDVANGRARFALRNISENPLNISAEELTERFIRGDVSRSTEGSGLGLSIAKELTKLQGGEFVLYLDGDLFKVTVEFPLV